MYNSMQKKQEGVGIHMWIAILAAVTVLAVISIIYLMRRFHQFRFLERLGEKHKLLSWILSAVPVAERMCQGT